MEEVFKTSVIEALQYYVYCLVDPRTNRIFYIGKGSGNRIFNHANDALNDNLSSLKLNIIREIRSTLAPQMITRVAASTQFVIFFIVLS